MVFDRRTEVDKNTIYIPSILHMTCELKAKDKYTLALLDFDFEMQTKWWIKLLFGIVIRMFQHKICKVLTDVKKDIEKSI